MNKSTYGKVYLVGAGPGDPGLLTLRGRELLERADVVVYDYLADSSMLEFCSPSAELVDVGKRPDRPVPQSEINEVLVSSARKYSCVVRLKGGDPFVFGRGGEEALDLIHAHIDFEVVPGISSAIAVPAYAGVPVTHRGLSTSFTVVTGHRHGKATDQVDWDSLAKLGGTIVVLMGVSHRAEISNKLIAGGLDPLTPVISVTWGTKANQSSLRTVLSELGNVHIKSPSTLVIGEVAGLNLSWFEQKPLLGMEVVVTRSREQASKLVVQLRELGAKVLAVPTIEFVEPSDGFAGLKAAIKSVSAFDWIIFTSPNTVSRFFDRVSDLRELHGVKIAAIGNSTAHEIERLKLKCDFVPSEFVSEKFVEEFPCGTGKILLPQAEDARDIIPKVLESKGWTLEVVSAYKTQAPQIEPDYAKVISAANAITFTSSSTVTNFISAFGLIGLPKNIISIGPVTTSTLNHHGITEVTTAQKHNIDGLIESVVSVLKRA